ncbi:cupredoxin domain-containing protein [Nitrospirillum sp. BR 11752]|uniref:cupredoxin domain-containing protein n=1 Tax=Nitrospirillum sp. BR 11752 TaxID=3104293 RepID=UPI002EA53555|nr:cupredoxin domain-containing protein [Nitrospirillum sp. BR 11752]
MSPIRTAIRSAALTLALGLFSVAARAEPATYTVTQKNGQYVPSTLTIKRGDIVIIRNDDKQPHHVVSYTPHFLFDLDLQAPGQENKIVFDTTEKLVVVSCDIHHNMELLVTVQQ